MVAVIKSGASIKNALHYNENKLKAGVAQLIHSYGFGKDTEKLGFTDKIKTLEKQASLNQRTRLNSVHISLNFDPSESLSQEKLRAIAETYMERIGFGNQPYLVYQHQDAGHPHIHLVTTNIQRDGTRIKMQNIGKNQSEKARKEIEQEFKLVKAQGHQLKEAYQLKPVNVQKVQYGKADTRRAITNVLDAILPNYKYTSLPELNAVLRQYNILADNGKEGSRMSKNGGLVYRILDEKGQPVGIPIKASLIYNKPTLKFLHEKFAQNHVDRQKHKLPVKNAIDLFMVKHPGRPLEELIKNLQQNGIKVVLRQNDKGIIYGITYIDHQTRCVFNGSDLGKPYSANQIQSRCSQDETSKPRQTHSTQRDLSITKEVSAASTLMTNIKDVIQELTKEEYQDTLASDLREEERRRKRKRQGH